MSGYKWVRVDVRKSIPASAVQGGHEIGGQPIYVGRALHNGDLIPAKVVPASKKAYLPFGGKEYIKHDVEVLVQTGGLSWKFGENGKVPPDAVIGGATITGEALYIGRAMHNGSLAVGKVHPSEGHLYISYDNKEFSYCVYEVLVHNSDKALLQLP